MSTLTPHQKLSAARLRAAERAPYLRAALLGLVPREVDFEVMGMPTFAVTHDAILLWNPKALESWSSEEAAAVLVHEVSHLLRDHHGRALAQGIPEIGDSTLARVWNIAGDAEINDDLIEGKWPLPAGCVTPPVIGQPNGRLVEEYFRALRDQMPEPQDGDGDGDGDASPDGNGTNEGDKDGGGGGQDDAQDGSAKASSGRQAKDSGEDGQNDGSKPNTRPTGSGGRGGKKPAKGHGSDKTQGHGDKPMSGDGWCGSCAGRRLPKGSGDEGGNNKGGQHIDGRTPADLARMRREVAEAIRSEAAKGRGTVPGGWARWAESALEPPRVNWRQKLAMLVRTACSWSAGAVDLTWRRPSRRQAGIGYGRGCPTLPAYHAPIPKVAIAVDTSGSMGDQELSDAMREVNGVLKAVGAEITILACDAAVHEVRKVRTIREAVGALKGGGGTDFNPVFEHIEQMHPRERPNVVIFATDGQGPAPAKPPRNMRVVWVLVGPYRTRPCTWGEFVEIDDTPRAKGKAA